MALILLRQGPLAPEFAWCLGQELLKAGKNRLQLVFLSL
jgi:hypothetical protein